MSDKSADTTESKVRTDGTPRRAVLAGITGVVGAALGLSSAAAASEMAGPDTGGVGSEDAPTCPPGCYADLYCCEYDGSTCVRFCWRCDCS